MNRRELLRSSLACCLAPVALLLPKPREVDCERVIRATVPELRQYMRSIEAGAWRARRAYWLELRRGVCRSLRQHYSCPPLES